MSQPSRTLESALLTIERFSHESNQEKLRLLATAVLPYGQIEDLKGVPEFFRRLKQCEFSENAVELLQRMLSKAGFKSEHVSLLNEHAAANTQQLPDMFFQELLISVADQLGDGEYLRNLVYVIPEEKIGIAPRNVKSAVHLLQRLLHEQTISTEDLSTLKDLAQWLEEIGRKDIAKKLSGFGTAVQEQGGLSQEVQCESSVLPLPQQKKQPQQESGCTSEGIPEQNASTRVPQQESGCSSRAVAEQHTPFGQQQQHLVGAGTAARLVSQSSSPIVKDIRYHGGSHRGVQTAGGVEKECTHMEDPMQPFPGSNNQINSADDLEHEDTVHCVSEKDTLLKQKVDKPKTSSDIATTSQHITTATLGKILCCVILVGFAFLCFCQSAVVTVLFGTHLNPASLQHLGYEGDTIVCDETAGPWYTEWTVSENLMQGDYNYDVQVCAVDQTQLVVYKNVVTLWNKNFSWPTSRLNLPPDLNRMPYLLKNSKIDMSICLRSSSATTMPANVLIFDNKPLNQEFLKSGVNHSVYSKNVPVGSRGQVKCSNVSYIVENPGYHYITLVKQGNVTIAENITIQVNYANISDCEGRKTYTVTTSESATIPVPSYPATLLCYIPESPVHDPTPYTTHIRVIRSITKTVIVVTVESVIGAVSLILILVMCCYFVVKKIQRHRGGGLTYGSS